MKFDQRFYSGTWAIAMGHVQIPEKLNMTPAPKGTEAMMGTI